MSEYPLVRAVAAGFLVGFVACGLIVAAAAALSGLSYSHDPMKMLQLRKDCLKDSPDLFATYCNDFAEKYSRIPKAPPR